jgi:hypothetical protein
MITPLKRRGNQNPFVESAGGVGNFREQEITSEAVVVDTIVNESHPEYASDGYNVGFIKFRAIKNDQYRQAGQLNWAGPLDSNITEYPLLNEIVLIVKSLNRYYYTRKVNTSSRVTSHPLFGLNDELSPTESSNDRAESYRTSPNPKVDGQQPSQKLGKYFEEQPSVYRLRSDEGDVIYEGRSGHSIRFGASWPQGTQTIFQGTKKQSPNIIIRVGQDSAAKPSVQGKYGLVREDINADASSVYLVTDQLVPLTYSTKGSSVHGKSVVDFPPKLDGNQIVINTDRFVVNTKKNKILGNSFLGIHWTTNKDFTVDADRDYVSQITRDVKVTIGHDKLLKVGHDFITQIGNVYDATASSRFSIIAPKVYVGLRQNDAQPIVCGAMIAAFLSRFLDAFIQNAAIIIPRTSAPNTPSQLNPGVVSILSQLKSDVAKGAKASFNSGIAFTTK